jgi:outer membrane protein assembly factor BamA
VIADAESAVYALGVFSSVRIEPEYREGSDIADLAIKVRRGRTERFRVGIGVMSGSLRTASGEEFSVPQWDVHLLVGYDHENFLGGMRKLRIEERPRLISLRGFPKVPDTGFDPGNTITLRFEQPRFPEARTVSFSDNQWDYGPDPFFGYFRHDLATRIGVQRGFFRQRLKVELALQHDLYRIDRNDPLKPDTVSSYRLPYAEQKFSIDLRNDERRPSRGVYLSSTLQEAVMLGYGSWTYVRWLPEVRAYQRLFWGIVLAERVAFGALFVMDYDASVDESGEPALDPTSRRLGPQNYRLRGGGATSNRGYAAGELGDGIDGGKRRWEATVELRIPLGGDLGMAAFFDTGDVNACTPVGDSEEDGPCGLRFNHPNAATGLGLRYYTPFAPIRFDLGWRIPSLQRLGDAEEDPKFEKGLEWHLTLGEAF